MSILLAVLGAASAGSFLAIGSAANAQLKQTLGSPIAAAAINLGACNGDVKVEEKTGDSMAVENKMVDSGATTTVGNTMDTAAGGLKTESVETVVESKLTLEPGFKDVEVSSKGEGMIVLSGMAATDAEKMRADSIAKATEGVKSVENNITVGAATK